MMLYNRPVSSGVDYFVNNSNDNKASKIDVEAGGFLKHKSMSKIDESEKAIVRGELCDPVGYDWMFKILMGKYREPLGEPTVRIAKQLGEAKGVITRDLEVGVRNPEGGWDWLGRKRRDLKSLGRPPNKPRNVHLL